MEQSNQTAYYIRENIGQDKNVLLIAQNSAFFIIAYLGILKSGNICIPLNPSIEQDNFEFIKETTESRMIFLSNMVKKRLNINDSIITEDKLKETIISQNHSLKDEPEFNGDRIAEIIFTSGSTALPKGVMLSHNNLITNTTSIIQYLDLQASDTVMVVLPFYYCYGLSLLHTHIRVGGSVVLNNNFIFLGSTINAINEYQCTGFSGVPSHFQILLRKTELFKNTKFPSLRYVTQAGGKLHNTFITDFVESFPEIKFFVMYGQTEATARLSYLPPGMIKGKMGSLGKGIPGVELKVINEKGLEIKPGETGEIVAKGGNIMLGYYKDPKTTTQTIRNGWLYTGDMATIDDEGYIYLQARKKEIIKVGGRRVSPKEIEEVILMLPGVIDCTIEAVDNDILGEAIKAILVINEHGKNISIDDIKQHCGSKLAQYKIPSYFEFKKTMEISPTGKKIKKIN